MTLEIGELRLSSVRNRKRVNENELCLKDLWHTVQPANICITGLSEREEREKGAERILEELMLKNFPNLMKNINIYIQEEYTFFSSSHGTFCKIDHMLDHKISTNKFKRISIMQSIFYNHSTLERN